MTRVAFGLFGLAVLIVVAVVFILGALTGNALLHALRVWLER